MAYDFKSEKDVKEYIKNLGIEYRFGCLSEKDPQSKILITFDIQFFFFFNYTLIIYSMSVTR